MRKYKATIIIEAESLLRAAEVFHELIKGDVVDRNFVNIINLDDDRVYEYKVSFHGVQEIKKEG